MFIKCWKLMASQKRGHGSGVSAETTELLRASGKPSRVVEGRYWPRVGAGMKRVVAAVGAEADGGATPQAQKPPEEEGSASQPAPRQQGH